tara:strand:- start:39061 stop:40371 length:1311 start_codon:yes stop_codon:yes gene_type:complete
MIYSLEAEQSVLGALLLDPDKLSAVSAIITAADFYDATNKLVWNAIEKCDKADTSIDMVTVATEIGMQYLSYLGDCADMVPTTANVLSYAKIVADKSKKRKLHAISFGIQNMVEDDAGSDELADYISSEVMNATEGRESNTQTTMGKAIKKLLERTDDRLNGQEELYSTGFKDLDDVMKLEGGRLMVLAGRPSMGKSTFGQNIMENNAKDGIPGYFATMEMPEEEIAARTMCSQGGVDNDFLQDPKGFTSKHTDSDDQWPKLSSAVNIAKDWPMEIDYSPGLRIADLKNRARAWFRKQKGYIENGKGILLIDYLGLMKMAGKDRVKEYGEVCKELKRFAGEMGIPIILICQLNRSLEQRPDKRPLMSDLRDSGEIEEDADIIAFVYRDEVYHEDSPDKGIAEIILRKSRNGKITTVRLMTELKHYRFRNLARGDYS